MNTITNILAALVVSGTVTYDAPTRKNKDALRGAWETRVAEGKEVMVMQDGYCPYAGKVMTNLAPAFSSP